jgi:hypothetical protein
MARVSPIQSAFNGGELTPLMSGQVFFEKRESCLELMDGMIALKQGAATRRGGTLYIKEVKDSSNRTQVIDFQYDQDDAFTIEIGDQYARFMRNNGAYTGISQDITGITKASPAVVTYSGSDTFANGDEVYISGVVGMTEVNNRYYLVANVNTGSNTFELQDIDNNNIDSTSYTTYSSGGIVQETYEIVTPYTQANLYDSNDIFQIHYFQSANVIYMLHGLYQPRALVRSGSDWVLNTLVLEDGPYLDTNVEATTLTLSGTSGSVTVTASATTGINGDLGFQTTDIGRLIRFKDPANNWTWLTITARTSTTVVTARIDGDNASAGTATTSWRLGAYSDTTGWPRTGTFFQGRFSVGGSTDFPDRYDLSKSGGYSDTYLLFAPTEVDGTVVDDNAISGTLPSRQVSKIQWMAADATGLAIGTAGQEWSVKASSSGEVITPSNATATPISNTKSAYIQPIFADSGLVFVQAMRRRIHDMIYSFDVDRLRPRDITILSEHITRGKVISIKYQQEPLNVLWCLLAGGGLRGMTYYPDQKVFGWHRHTIGGYSDVDGTLPAVVESISVAPSADGSRDELTMIVRRSINGVTRRYIEYMTRYYEDDMALEDAIQLDCALTYSGTATNVVNGLDHLEGETVRVMIDGKSSRPDPVVTNGSITLPNGRTGSKIHIGFANRWQIKTLEMEAGAQDGTAQGKKKKIHRVILKVSNALSLMYGSNSDTLDEYTFGQGAEYDETPTLFTGNTPPLVWPGGFDTSGQMYFTSDSVFPFTINAIMPQMVTHDG